jgi:Flp pilus assembly CpaF family ATPase/pSer/pThr/pTyr-binding forkhead associated (FHA) protein
VLQVVVHEKGGTTRRVEFTGDAFSVGRGDDNSLVLDRANVSTHHLRMRRKDGVIEVSDLDSTNGTYVNGRRLNETRPVRRSDRIYLGDFILMLEGDDDAIAVLDRVEVKVEGKAGRTPLSVPPAGVPLGTALPGSGYEESGDVLTSARRVAAPGVESKYLDKIANRVLETVLVNVRRLDPLQAPDISEDDQREVARLIDALLNEMKATGQVEQGVNLDTLKGRITRELVNLGPLDELMKDETVREIHVVGGGPIRVVRESSGGAVSEMTERRFSGDRALVLAIQRQARARGFLVEGAQVLEGKVADGFYMYGLVPPNPVRTPVLSLRRTMSDATNLAALVSEEVLSRGMRDLIAAAVQGKRRILVCASGGVNLDRFMGALVGEIPDELRVACISDTGRLGASRRGWIQVRRIGDPSDGVGLSDSMGLILRGGLDLVVSQRCRHEDAAAVIDAMSGATQGAIVSLWGIDSAHGLSRLSALSTVASGAIAALTVALARSVDLLIRLGVGVNQDAMQIIEIVEPRVKEGGEIVHMPIFKAQRKGEGGTSFTPTGTVPMFLRDLTEKGINLPVSLFKP